MAEKNYFSGIKKSSICLDCKKSVGLCSWSHSFVPVEGWKAKGVKTKSIGESYLVEKCPEFESDANNRVSLAQLNFKNRAFFNYLISGGKEDEKKEV